MAADAPPSASNGLLPFDYPAYLTSEYQGAPKLAAWLGAPLALLDDILFVNAGLDALFDLDTASGATLDILGQMIGQGRTVGFQPSNGVSPTLDDASYRLLLKARLAQNQWDGRIDSLQAIWQSLFPGGSINLQDAQNMTASVIVTGVFTGILWDLISQGYIVPRPEGVLYEFVLGALPAFGTDQDNGYIAGFDHGHLA